MKKIFGRHGTMTLMLLILMINIFLVMMIQKF